MQLKAHTKQFRRTFTHMQFVFVIGVSTAMRARTTLKYGELCDNNIQMRGRRPHFKLVWMRGTWTARCGMQIFRWKN